MSEVHAVHAAFRVGAKRYLAAHPEMQSVMIAVAQYWCDEAEDAVHEELFASARVMPLWPHRCGDAHEACARCGDDLDFLDRWHDNSEELIMAIAPYCQESFGEERATYGWGYHYLPYLLARRAGDEVELEVIGKIQRPSSPAAADRERDDTWDDPRAAELLAQVVAAPAEDGPRRVLADYLMERENPRGQYIALCLEPPTLPCVAQREELLAEHAARWLHPIHEVVLRARWDRGFPVEVEVLGGTPRRGAVWRTIEKITSHGGESLLVDDMLALRTLVGKLDDTWTSALARGSWNVATLEIHAVGELAKAPLPALRHLIANGELDAAAFAAPWWPQLQRLTLVGVDRTVWQARYREVGVPWLAIVAEERDTGRSWEVAFGPGGACEVTQRGWSPRGGLDALAEILPTLPVASVTLVPSEYYAPSSVDVERLQPATAIPISVR